MSQKDDIFDVSKKKILDQFEDVRKKRDRDVSKLQKNIQAANQRKDELQEKAEKSRLTIADFKKDISETKRKIKEFEDHLAALVSVVYILYNNKTEYKNKLRKGKSDFLYISLKIRPKKKL